MIQTGKQRWSRLSDSEIEDEIESGTLPRVEAGISDPVDADCPNNCLCHNVDRQRVAEQITRFSDKSFRTDVVYVLECRPRTVTEKIVREEFLLQRSARWASRAQKHDRLLYVGVSQRPMTRLLQHAAGRGNGANFTQIFPAARLLSIDWYQSTPLAYRAEPITADVLEENLGDDVFVSQPG